MNTCCVLSPEFYTSSLSWINKCNLCSYNTVWKNERGMIVRIIVISQTLAGVEDFVGTGPDEVQT